MRFDNAPRPSLSGDRLFRPLPHRPLALLQNCPTHKPTPLHDVEDLAQALGVSSLAVKDESARMGLGSFKALGGAYAIAQMIHDTCGTADLAGDEARAVATGMTFITASAGNHGLSVAAGARVFGAKAVIVLAEAVPEAFAERIRQTGAEVQRVAGSYEDSVAHAMAEAEGNSWLHLADGSWDGYVERPALIMEGYTVLADECRMALETAGEWPSHVFLQAGVGGLAAAMAANIRETWPVDPVIVVVEPEAAPCLLESVRAGTLTRGDGPVSNMGRLDCKEASLISFEALRHDADVFLTVTDEVAAAAAALLGQHDMKTTPSGAAGLAGLQAFDPGKGGRCLVVMSEGPE